MTDPADWRNTDVTVAAGGAVQTTTLVGTPGIYGGQPAGSVPLGSAAVPGTWDISVPTGVLGPPSGWIDDLVLIATYQVALAPS